MTGHDNIFITKKEKKIYNKQFTLIIIVILLLTVYYGDLRN
jgi:hypothetical protein